jgi:hypothetical protein
MRRARSLQKIDPDKMVETLERWLVALTQLGFVLEDKALEHGEDGAAEAVALSTQTEKTHAL